jgi:hypothetical protein
VVDPVFFDYHARNGLILPADRGVCRMRVELYGLGLDAPGATFYLWSPWRCTALEHKSFEALRALPQTDFENGSDEYRLHLTDPKTWKSAIQTVARVMKGWQEEAAEGGGEKRYWRWLIEADVDADGFDHAGERASLWAFLRLSLDRGSPGEGEKWEDIDLDGFGLCVWGQSEARR